MGGGWLVGGLLIVRHVGNFPAVEAEVPGGIGVCPRPVFMAEEDAGCEDEENKEDWSHGIRIVFQGPAACG